MFCKNTKTIFRNSNGQISYCKKCKIYYINFNNILLELYIEELMYLRDLVLNQEKWVARNKKLIKSETIPIPTLQENLILLFDKNQIEGFKELLFMKKLSNKIFMYYDYSLN
tara:strand:+ start:63 stop:398 length:336 start_codon:yes stop_codon:yes gene_type:complete